MAAVEPGGFHLLLYIGVVTFVAALLVCLPLSRHITWPLKRMITVVEKMAAGEFGATVTKKGFQEIELLFQAFNDLDKQLTETVDELNRVEALRRELVTNVSHELRTPLTSLQGFLELAAEPGTTPAKALQNQTFLLYGNGFSKDGAPTQQGRAAA